MLVSKTRYLTVYKVLTNRHKYLMINYLTEYDVHYLFPQEWYDYIPFDLVVYDINGQKNEASIYNSNDVRYGCLPFGLVRKEIDGKINFNKDLGLGATPF